MTRKEEWECGIFHTWEIGKEKVTAIVELWNGVRRVDPKDIVFTDDYNQRLRHRHDLQEKDPDRFKECLHRHLKGAVGYSTAQN